MENQRTYDIIIWGASGFTGKLVVEYIQKQYGQTADLKWAIAGRNQQKLEKIRAEVATESLPILIADSQDLDSLNALAKNTKVVCTTVGPYAKYGSKLVEACIEQGTHYCDLTGEVQWMHRMINQHHEAAKAKGVKIVHTCGFDSIPSDMGVFFMQNEAKKQKGMGVKQIKMRVKAMKGEMSGGTYASLNNVLEEAKEDNSIFEVLGNPYSLNPKGMQSGPDKPDLRTVVYDEEAKAWICPFVMAGINTKVVRRSNALSNFAYGKDFRYDEATMTGPGFGGKAKAWAATGMMGLLMAAKPDSLLKKGMNKLLPKPGEGPSKIKRETGFFNLLLLGTLEDGSKMRAKVTGDRDPGYGSTSKMLAESAICLAKDELPEVAGMLTPAVAMGTALLDRLQQNAGLEFMILE